MLKMKSFIAVVSCLICSAANGYEIYVSPSGSDFNPGSKTRPVYSLPKARERAEELIKVRGYPREGMTVWIAAGNYSFPKTLLIEAGLRGTNDKPLLFKGAGGQAVFSGGINIDVSSAKRVDDAVTLERLAPSARGNVYQVQVKDAKLRSLLAKDSAQLSQEGKMMNLAKYPNVGYGHIDKILEAGAIYAHGRTKGEIPKFTMDSPIGGVFTVLSKDVEAWEKEFNTVKKAKVTGYLSNDWYKKSHRIASIEAGEIKLLEYSRYGVVDKKQIPRRIIVSNLLCELDQEGEFYFDDKVGVLFVWPFGGSIDRSKISLWGGVPFAQLKNTHNARFENLVVEGVSQGTAVVEIKDCENIELAGCTIRNCSRPAVMITGGKHCGLRSCDIYDVPHHVTLNGGVVRELIPSAHEELFVF